MLHRVAELPRGAWQRLLGIPASRRPADPGCWTFEDGEIVIDLERAPELRTSVGALRLEGSHLPVPVLVFRGDDGAYHAFHNRCPHRGRRLDPVPGTATVQCCSVRRSTFDYGGRVLSGPACRSLVRCPASRSGTALTVRLLRPERVERVRAAPDALCPSTRRA